MMRLLLGVLLLAGLGPGPAAGPASQGEVRVPLPVYTELLGVARADPRPAPARYAIGISRVDVKLAAADGGSAATVRVSLVVEVFEDEWTLVPLLPPGVALSRASVDGSPAQLVGAPQGLSWITASAGTHRIALVYGVDARRTERGYVVSVPVPRAAATSLRVRHPRQGVELSVVPGASIQTLAGAAGSAIAASVPSTSAVMLSWRVPSERPYAISRARYQGLLEGHALIWTARYDVEVFEEEMVTVALMASTVTLGELRVDGEPATVLERDGEFVTVVQGSGVHRVEASFQVPVLALDGPPRARVLVPRVPVSRFELVLPGNKELSVSPAANVVGGEQEGSTASR